MDGGRGRARTGGLLVANEALSQLSYTPIVFRLPAKLHEAKRFYHFVVAYADAVAARWDPESATLAVLVAVLDSVLG
jgi:hypothetical protein